MRVENFSAGIYTDPAEIRGGETRAADMVNLRVDQNGFLTQRYGLGNARGIGNLPSWVDIQGIAKVGDIIFYNDPERALWVQRGDENPTPFWHITDLRGRLSVIDHYANYTILTSEGEDAGYYVQLEPAIVFFPLSFPAPNFPNLSISVVQYSTSTSPPIDKYHYYTFVFKASDNAVVRGARSKKSVNYEAEPLSAPAAGDDPEVRRLGVVDAFVGIDNSVTIMEIYRSKGFDEAVSDPQALDNSVFRYIGEVDKADNLLTWDDTVDQATWDSNDLLVEDTGFPSTATSITEFQGHIFATCGDELRYNEVEDGLTPRPGSWPHSNALTVGSGGGVTFAVSYFNSLLFGDREATYRLYGNVPPFAIAEHTTGRGALNTYCTLQLTRGIGMITENGLYISDGTQMTKVSSPLEEFFRNDYASDGCIIQFPSDDILWCVTFASESHRQFLMRRVGNANAFEGWEDVEVKQAVKRVLSGEVQISAGGRGWSTSRGGWSYRGAETENTAVICALDGLPREIDWNDTYSIADTDWKWESHEIYDKTQTLAMNRKIYRNIYINGYAQKEIDILFTTDKGSIKRTVDLNIDKGQPIRVPIRKYGQYLKFRILGNDVVQLRGFYLEYEAARSLQ